MKWKPELKEKFVKVVDEIERERRLAVRAFESVNVFYRMGWINFIKEKTSLDQLYQEADNLIGQQRRLNEPKIINGNFIFNFT